MAAYPMSFAWELGLQLVFVVVTIFWMNVPLCAYFVEAQSFPAAFGFRDVLQVVADQLSSLLEVRLPPGQHLA